MFDFRNHLRFAALLGAGLTLGLYPGQASAQTVVTCPAQSIQAAINGGASVIEFSGTCNEFVFINRSGVTVRGNSGNPANDVITQGLVVASANNVFIEDLTVRGFALFLRDGAYAFITNTTVDNTVDGLAVIRQSGARLDQVTVTPTTGTGNNNCSPLCVGETSNVRMTNSTITGTVNNPAIGGAAVAFRNASITIREGNTITNTGSQPAVLSAFNSNVRIDNPPAGTRTEVSGDVAAFSQSLVDIREVDLTGDVNIDFDSALQLGSLSFGGDPANIDIDGSVLARRDSDIVVVSPAVSVTGDMTCEDRSSSLGGTPTVGGEIDCRDFDERRVDDDDD